MLRKRGKSELKDKGIHIWRTGRQQTNLVSGSSGWPLGRLQQSWTLQLPRLAARWGSGAGGVSGIVPADGRTWRGHSPVPGARRCLCPPQVRGVWGVREFTSKPAAGPVVSRRPHYGQECQVGRESVIGRAHV